MQETKKLSWTHNMHVHIYGEYWLSTLNPLDHYIYMSLTGYTYMLFPLPFLHFLIKFDFKVSLAELCYLAGDFYDIFHTFSLIVMLEIHRSYISVIKTCKNLLILKFLEIAI